MRHRHFGGGSAITVAALCVAASPAPSQTISKLIWQEPDRPLYTNNSGFMVSFNAGMVAGIEDRNSLAPLLYTLTLNNRKDKFPLQVPGGFSRITAIAIGADGTLAAAGDALEPDGTPAAYIIRIGPQRNDVLTIPTFPFRADVIAIAPGGKIWAIGNDQCDNRPGQKWVHNVMKRYDRAGKLIGSHQIQVKSAPDSSPDVTFWSSLRASSDRVVWMTGGHEYIEFSLDGSETFRINGPRRELPDVASLALSQDNVVVYGCRIGPRSPSTWGLWSLDRLARRWQLIEVEPADRDLSYSYPLGFDNHNLITFEYDRIQRYAIILGVPETDEDSDGTEAP